MNTIEQPARQLPIRTEQLNIAERQAQLCRQGVWPGEGLEAQGEPSRPASSPTAGQ